MDAFHTTTPNLADPVTSTGRSTPPSIEHRCLAYCYTKLGRSTPHQSSMDTFHTTIPNLPDLVRSTGQSTPPQSIKHRWLAYCYTKLGRSSQIYWQIYPPPFQHRSVQHNCTACVPCIDMRNTEIVLFRPNIISHSLSLSLSCMQLKHSHAYT